MRVEIEYDDKYKVPADAKAVVVAPSIVSDRYVQLTPVYTGGPTLADGADLPARAHRRPVELDQIYQSLDELNVALGPEGANKDGALSPTCSTSAPTTSTATAQTLNATLTDFSTAVQHAVRQPRTTCSARSRNLQTFTTTLAAERRAGPARSTPTSRRSPTSWRASARTSRRR